MYIIYIYDFTGQFSIVKINRNETKIRYCSESELFVGTLEELLA